MSRIEGEIIQGMGAAAGAVEKQLPELQKYEPLLASCHPGTLNVMLNQPLFVRKWDIVTDPIHWYVRDPNHCERFGLLSVVFLHQDTVTNAWIFDPHNSPHRLNPFLVEILAPKLDAQIGDRCNLDIRHPTKTRSYLIVG